MTTIEKVGKGNFFKLPKGKSVYVSDVYNRHTQKYSAYKADDINHFIEKKKGTQVIIEFEY